MNTVKLKLMNSLRTLKYCSSFFVFLLVTISSFANSIQNPNEEFKKANDFYAQTKYNEAISIYETLIASNYNSTHLFYNLANAYYKKNDIPSAILYYEKALKLQPDNEDALFNLKLANTKTIDKIEEGPEMFVNKTWIQLISSKTADSWAFYTIALIFLSLVLFIVYLISYQFIIKKSSFYGGLLFLFFGLFCWFLASQNTSYNNNAAEGIIFTQTVTIKSEPNVKSEKLFTLHEGTKVKVIEHSDNWVKIKMPNNNEGWIKNTDVKLI